MEAQKQCGTIEIKTSLLENKVYLSVADSGCGISEEHMAKIFFFSTKENGTGLGLSVCAGIVSRHGGTIEVQSAISKEQRL